MEQKDYNRIMGLDTVDIGSKRSLLREIKKIKKGNFSKLKKKQLKGIFYENKAKL